MNNLRTSPPKFLQKPSPYFFHGAFAPSFIWRRRRCVRLSQHGHTAANPLLQVCCSGPGRQEISIDCMQACTTHSGAAPMSGECGQCHVVSVRRKLNTDLLRMTPFIWQAVILVGHRSTPSPAIKTSLIMQVNSTSLSYPLS